jgi:hypothetical protein
MHFHMAGLARLFIPQILVGIILTPLIGLAYLFHLPLVMFVV